MTNKKIKQFVIEPEIEELLLKVYSIVNKKLPDEDKISQADIINYAIKVIGENMSLSDSNTIYHVVGISHIAKWRNKKCQ